MELPNIRARRMKKRASEEGVRGTYLKQQKIDVVMLLKFDRININPFVPSVP